MVAPSKLFSFANSSITPCLCTRPQGPFSANAKRLEIQQKKLKEAHEKEKNETGTCRKHDNSGSKTTLKR